MALTPYAELLFPCIMECLEGDAAGAHGRVDKANEKLTPIAETIYADFAGNSEEMSDGQWSAFLSAFADACLVIDGKLMGTDEAGEGAKAKFAVYKEQKSSKDKELYSLIAKGDKVGKAEVIAALVLGKCEPVPPPAPQSMMNQKGIQLALLFEHMAITSEG